MTKMVESARDARDAKATAALVARCRRGDTDAWPEFVRRFSPYVHVIAVRGYRLSEEDAQDVFQEVFLRAWTHLGSLRDDGAIQPWLAQLTRRLAIDRLRARAREVIREDLDTLRDIPTQEALEGLEESLTVHQAIARLPRIHREIVHRFFVRGQSHATIAADLGIAEGTVASRVCRARERLRVQLAV
jgi:RNA polymerase sigma-70 factor (ECF subfamily)